MPTGWGRGIRELGHEVRLVPPIHVKPFVKRRKNDASDAEAICEAASRPTMHFVPVKSEERQSRCKVFRTQELLVRQRMQTVNALRGQFAEFGLIAPQGIANIERPAMSLADASSSLPAVVREMADVLLGQTELLGERINEPDRRIRTEAREDEAARRLMTIPGVGPITATAIQAFAPPMEGFGRSRDFSAWLGLVPRQHTTGGKQRLGRVSKMGQRDLRRQLHVGAMAEIRWAVRRRVPEGSWLARMLSRKPRRLVAMAMANRTARIAWALMTGKESHRDPVATAA